MSLVQWVGLVFVILGALWLLWAYARARQQVMWQEMAAELRRRELEERHR